MRHITDEEILDFVSMSNLDGRSLMNASVVTAHIAECNECFEKVKAFQILQDEFVNLCSGDDFKCYLNKEMKANIDYKKSEKEHYR